MGKEGEKFKLTTPSRGSEMVSQGAHQCLALNAGVKKASSVLASNSWGKRGGGLKEQGCLIQEGDLHRLAVCPLQKPFVTRRNAGFGEY